MKYRNIQEGERTGVWESCRGQHGIPIDRLDRVIEIR